MANADALPDSGLDARRSAVALSYGPGDGAPVVVAKGYGDVAEMIIRRGREAGVFVHDSPDLVRLLLPVALDKEIPPDLYFVVAELLAWLHGLEGIEGNPAKKAMKSIHQNRSVHR
jgi:flagellar biosynthesis protein